jgi:alcohol dehydrogenase (cytochrome c)
MQYGVKGLDPETGKPIEYDPNKQVQRYNASVTPHRENKVADICPGNMGGKNWPPTPYNPDLKLWYIPVIESCNRITVEEMAPEKLKAREFWTGGGPSQPFKITGSVTAIDVTTGKIAGKLETPFPNLGGILATPDLVFSGQPSGEVMALDAKTLEKRWEFSTGGGVNAPPMTFAVDGKQYIAILVGLGGAWDKWFIDSTPELKRTAHRDKIDTGISVDTRSPNWRQTHDQGYSCQPVLRDIARCRFELRLIGCGSIRRTHRGDRLCVPGSGCWRWLAG